MLRVLQIKNRNLLGLTKIKIGERELAPLQSPLGLIPGLLAPGYSHLADPTEPLQVESLKGCLLLWLP